MKNLIADVVVIGGGATGVGAVRDAAMRGLSAVLIERADLGQGTTGRYHGLLHSGGRYVVSDPHSATECAEENRIISRIHADAVEKTGGLFVVTPEDDMEFSDRFAQGAIDTKVPCTEITPGEALRIEPRLNPGIKRAFRVEDGTVDGWKMVWGAAYSAQEYGAKIFPHTRATAINVSGGQVQSVECEDSLTGNRLQISTRFVINAGGPWAGHIAQMAGCHGVEVVPGRGIMIAMGSRLVSHVVNRCIYPADGDILVPVHTVSIIGTTDKKVDDPDRLAISRAEVLQMLAAGEVLIPGFRQQRAVHAWAGARPLVKDSRVSASDTRHMSRGMSIIDHEARDGVSGLVTIVGGKLTTYRLMAKNTVDFMCEQLGEDRACMTDKEEVPGSSSAKNYQITHRLEEREKNWQKDQIICECELMTRAQFAERLEQKHHPHPPGQCSCPATVGADEDTGVTLDDLRRQLRLGMGPCQGGFCSLRAASLLVANGENTTEEASERLRLFLKNRWIGLWPILYGPQIRQTATDFWILYSLLNLPHMPGAEQTGPAIPDLDDTDAMDHALDPVVAASPKEGK